MSNRITAAIRAAIKEQGLSQYELAKLSGVDQAAISRLLAGGDIRCNTADRLCKALNILITD